MDLSQYHNPYDFANPVSDETLFAGRKDELGEIRYYLDHARTAPRAINIALIGARASGKTSLLNICEIESQKRDFCTVRINLDESDVENQLVFFNKIFDSILCSVCESGAFGGLNGKTYEAYFNIINTYDIPEKKTFCTFSFPLEYAMAMKSGIYNKPLSDHNYGKDLSKFACELKKPIILLMDECNVLSLNKAILQKLRNIFMNLKGYMLVFTGTNELFPVMDEVFSPIIRQFKKVNVIQFKHERETEECVIKPLKKLGIDYNNLIDFETFYDIEEIHKLSGGMPYEIQLICHKLFERVQTKKALKMKLDIGILEDVRKELETTQDIYKRPILMKIKNLKKKQLEVMNILCKCNGYASFEQVWQMEYFLCGQTRCCKDELKEELHYFIKEEIFKIKDDIIIFNGDEFDKIYTKYLAREQDIFLNFLEISLEGNWNILIKAISSHFMYKSNNNEVITLPDDINDVITKLSNPDCIEDIFTDNSFVLKDLYFLILSYKNKNFIPAIKIRFNMLGIDITRYFSMQDINSSNDNIINWDIVKNFEEKANELGGKLILQQIDLPTIPQEVLIQKVENSKNEDFKKELCGKHFEMMSKEYIYKENLEEALFHGELASRYGNKECMPVVSNNLGYLFLSKGELCRAMELIQEAIIGYKEAPEIALAYYNLSIVYAKFGNFDKGLSQIELCIEKIEKEEKDKRKMLCLFLPRFVNGELKFEEVKEEIKFTDKIVELSNKIVEPSKKEEILKLLQEDIGKAELMKIINKDQSLKENFLKNGYIEYKLVDLLDTAVEAKENLLLYINSLNN